MVEQGEFTPDKRIEMWQDQIEEECYRFLDRRPISLEELHVQGLLIDPNSYSPADILAQKELRGHITELLAPLSELERTVLTAKFGFDTGRERSQREIGREIGRTQPTVSRIERRAFAKLRAAGVPEHLREYLQ